MMMNGWLGRMVGWSAGRPKWPPVAEESFGIHDKTGHLSALQSLFNKHRTTQRWKTKHTATK